MSTQGNNEIQQTKVSFHRVLSTLRIFLSAKTKQAALKMTPEKLKHELEMDLEKNQKPEIQLYKKRWFMLGIFISYTFLNSIQWSEYTIIANLVAKFYDVPSKSVDYTSVVFMVAYLPLIIPALWLLNKKGIRFCMMLSCFGLTLGSWIKVYASTSRDLFVFVLIGQSTQAIFQVLAFGLAARVAALWFGSHEVSFACSLAVFGDQLGSAFGFLLPSTFVKGSSSEGNRTSELNTSGSRLNTTSEMNTTCQIGSASEIGPNLLSLNLLLAVISSIIFLFALIFFRERPKTPPSTAQIVQRETKDSDIIYGLKKGFGSISSVKMILSYGINIACFNTYVVLFNNIFDRQFKNTIGQDHINDQIGIIGALIMISGIVGSIIIGYILDKTHLYKATTLVIYFFSFLATLFNVFALYSQNLILVYLSNIFIGFCQVGYYSIAIQLCIETTYPLSEGFSSSLLLLGSHVLGILFSHTGRQILDKFGYSQACLGLASLLLLGTFITVTIPSKMKRYKAERFSKQPPINAAI